MNTEKDDLIRQISHKHTPDSIREECYRELEEKYDIERELAKELADSTYGDYWD